MKKTLTLTLSIAVLMLIGTFPAEAKSTAGGLLLIEPFGARAAALGEAISSTQDDITAFGYNPASLAGLTSKQASFFFINGFMQDSVGRASLGIPLKRGALGLSLSLYNAGDIDIQEGGQTSRVNAARDTSAVLGYGVTLGQTRYGIAAKFFQSELGETAKASAAAVDIGFQKNMGSRLLTGISLQNIGSDLKYKTESVPLPRIFRSGVSYHVPIRDSRLSLSAEESYRFDHEAWTPGVAAEWKWSLLVFRSGYRFEKRVDSFSAGMGVNFQGFSLDYALGFAQDIDPRHFVSLNYAWK